MPESSDSVSFDRINSITSFSMRQNAADTGTFSYNDNNHHDLASFSLLPDPHAAADIFASFSGSDHHDLASFSMHQSAADANHLPSFNIHNHHDLASFSLPAADLYPPAPGHHDLASFSIIPHPAFGNEGATSDIHIELNTLPLHSVSRDTMLASSTNLAAVSMSTTASSASERASGSIMTSTPPGTNLYTPVLTPA